MPRTKPNIYIESVENEAEMTESDLRQWVRATQILMRAKARRDARLAAQAGQVRRTLLSVSFHIDEPEMFRAVVAAV